MTIDADPDAVISDDEAKRIIMAVLVAADRQGTGMSTGEAVRVIGWAEQVRIDSALLRLLLDGKIECRWPATQGEPHFWEKGKAPVLSQVEVEAILAAEDESVGASLSDTTPVDAPAEPDGDPIGAETAGSG